ncbi:MAG: class I SAM-dependent methyltransferase [Vicinamibacterales bacterium]
MSPTEIPCALCGARDTTRLYTKYELGIERCRRCGLVYANPRAPEADILSRYSHDYFWHEYLPAAGAPEGRIDFDFIDGRNAAMLRLIRRHSPSGTRMLEIGSAAGLFLKAAERAGWEVGGVELSAAAADFARGKLGLDVRPEPVEAMTFPEGAFDVAVMFDVIEHLFDPRTALQATRRALTPGGILVVSTPNLNALSRHALGVDWAVLSPREHMYYFTERTLDRMVQSSGFGPATFERRFDGRDVDETMNYRQTHAPGHWRARWYKALLHRAGETLLPIVQTTGRADAIICVASNSAYGAPPDRAPGDSA